MKRVLAVLLCILCAMLLLVACGDETDTNNDTNASTDTNTDTNQGTNNTDNQGHTHTFKTNADWSYDAQGHWYDATCDCEDVEVTKLNHVDANNDGACDVCTYTNHEHEYSEEWTADCTNHWNAADCGHTVAGANVAPHEDSDEDGRCDVCNYIIEDIHQHYYSTEWTTDGEYHWHAALCEHKVEVTGKEAHVINAAGFCTVCNQKLKEIDKTDILAVLEAAIANNYKVISGNVNFSEIVYDTSTSIENKGTDEVFFVLGNGDSYILLKNYDKNDKFIGGEQQYFESISDEEIFGVMVEIGSIDLKPTSGLPEKLNGYNYTPGSILAAGYDDTSTLAQTIANLYDLMSKGDHIANSKTNYDAKTGKYSFSYEYLAVNATSQHPSSGAGGEAVMDYQVYLYYVDVEFTVNDDMVINLCNFSVESYRNWEKDTDLVYYPETDTYELLETASPTIYTYEVSQTSGERTYTTIYPRASFMPIDFDLFFVTATDYNDAGQMYVKEETPIIDVDGDGIVDLILDKETYTRLHIGGLIPSSAIPSFMNTEDFEVICENLDEGNGLLWGTDLFQDPTYSGYMDCIAFRTSANSGKYLVTIRFGQVTKKICVTIPGTPTVVIPDDTADTKYVYVSSVNGWEDKYTFTANESGKYTFTLPVGLGFVFEGADTPEYDPFHPVYADQNEHTVEFTLAKGESVTFFVGAEEKGVFAIKVAFEASATPDPDPTPDTPTVAEKPLNENGSNAVNGANVAFTFTASSNGVLTIKYGGFVAMDGGESSGTVTYSINGGEAIDVVGGNVENKINLNKDDKIVITVISNCYATIISAWTGERPLNDYNTTIVEGSNTLYFSQAEISADKASRPLTITVAGNYAFNASNLFVLNVTDAQGNTYTKNDDYTITLVPGEYFVNFSMLSMYDVPADVAQPLNLENKTPAGGEGGDGEEDEFVKDELKETLHLFMPNNGTYDFMFLTQTDNYYVNIYNSKFDMFFTYELADNGDGSYNMTVAYAEREGFTYNEEYATEVEETVFVLYYDGIEWTMDGQSSGEEPEVPADPVKESLLGTYTVGDYNVFIYNSYTSDGYIAEVYTDGYLVDLYFTFDVTDNGDGSYKLALTYLSRPDYEAGTDKVDKILALDIVITPSNEEEEKTPLEELDGTFLDNALNGYNVGFYYDVDALVYYLNVYGGADDLYYICQVTENADGSVTLVLDFDENHWQYCGAEKTDVYELNGKTVVATKNDGAWTFAVAEAPAEGGLEGEGTDEAPFVIPEAGDYVSPYQGGYVYPYFQFTATANGYVIISSDYVNFNLQYGTVIDTPNSNMGQNGYLNEVKLYVFAGTTVYFNVADNTFPEEAVDVPFTVSFEAFESEDPSFLKGTWNGAQVSMQGVTPYSFTIDAEGKGSGSYTEWGQATEFVIDNILVDGSNVTINVTTGGWFAQELSFSLVYDEETDTLSGDINLEKTKALGLESYQINATDDKYIYYATQNIVINLKVGASVMAGNVTVSYSVNGGEVKTLTFNENADVELNMGDKLTVVIEADTYSSLTASRVYPLGSQQNPIKIESLPFDMTHAGNEQEKYYIYTATEDIILTIACPEGCLVSGTGVSKDDNGNYVVTLTKGASLTLNPWVNTADASADLTYTYTITGEIPVVEEPDEGGDGTNTTYLSANNGGRYIMFEISGTTLTVTRSDMTGNFGTGGASTAVYTLSGSGASTTATRVSGTTCTFVFDDNGLPTTITWSGKAYTDFVKQ